MSTSYLPRPAYGRHTETLFGINRKAGIKQQWLDIYIGPDAIAAAKSAIFDLSRHKAWGQYVGAIGVPSLPTEHSWKFLNDFYPVTADIYGAEHLPPEIRFCWLATLIQLGVKPICWRRIGHHHDNTKE